MNCNDTLDLGSILLTIKKNLGLVFDDDDFNADIIMAINTAFGILHQIGLGPEEGFVVTDVNTQWDDFVSDSRAEMIKSFVYLKVRQIFDPPQNSYLNDVIQKNLDEIIWRLSVYVDNTSKEA